MDPLSPTSPYTVERPVMFQAWNLISFLHWRYPAQFIQRLLPPGLTVELYDSSAWVGLIPFVVEGLRPAYLPPLPWISQFPETNVRTYVRGPDNSRGIWFFTLEAARMLAVIGGRTLYGLPYRHASMKVEKHGDALTYTSSRNTHHGAACTHIGIQFGSRIQSAQRDIFLTARFRMFMSHLGRLWYTDVTHPPWTLHEARITRLDQSLLESLSLSSPAGEPLVHYSPGVQTRISAPRLFESAAVKQAAGSGH